MTYTTEALSGVSLFDDLILPRGKTRRAVFSAVLVAFGIVTAAWAVATLAAACMMMASSLTPTPHLRGDQPVALTFAPKTIALGNPYGALASAADSSSSPLISSEAWPLPDLSVEATSFPDVAALDAAVPLPPKRDLGADDSAPLPPIDSRIQPKRDIARSSPRENGQRIAAAPPSAVNAPQGGRNLFQKFFDALNPLSGAVVADAPPDDRRGGVAPPYKGPSSLPGAGSRVALYDIEAHTVYMPNGERLEAHSGLGDRLDDPRYVSEKDRGPTPPHAYDLTLREQLFHGVAALRLTPADGGSVYGRTGLLAHRYMLGPRGDSNGCVSFRDYPRFLQAFKNGEVTRLVVVARLAPGSSGVASASRKPSLRYAANQ